MEPVSDADQSCRSFHLAVTPAAEVYRYQDGFGNRVHHFNVLGSARTGAHPRRRPSSRRIRGRSIWPPAGPSTRSTPTSWAWRCWISCSSAGRCARRRASTPVLDALRPRPRNAAGRSRPACQPLHPRPLRVRPGRDAGQFAGGRRAGTGQRRVPGFHPPDDRGAAVVRRAGPLRQRLHPPAQPASRRATPGARRGCRTWGGSGSTRPTTASVDEHFIKVAVGRDFTDVPPNKGVYRGRVQEAIHVRVETRELQSLPSLSWQEQLPPLNVPLTAIRPVPRTAPGNDVDSQQQ